MKTEKLKISLAQRILSLDNNSILEKINELLNKQDVVAYNSKGLPVSKEDYIKDLDKINAEIDNGNAVLLSSNEVKIRIIDANNLV